MEVPTLVRIFVWITLWKNPSRLTVWRERDITYRTYRDYIRLQTPFEHLQFKCSVRDQESRPDGIVLANSTLCGTCTFTEAKTDGHHWPLGIVAETTDFSRYLQTKTRDWIPHVCQVCMIIYSHSRIVYTNYTKEVCIHFFCCFPLKQKCLTLLGMQSSENRLIAGNNTSQIYGIFMDFPYIFELPGIRMILLWYAICCGDAPNSSARVSLQRRGFNKMKCPHYLGSMIQSVQPDVVLEPRKWRPWQTKRIQETVRP